MADGKPADKAKDADRAAHLNIFSDDGSFLERFKLLKGEEDAKKKNEASLRRKRDWEEALKNRKKRAKKADDADGPSGGTKAADGDTKAAPRRDRGCGL
ncbi:hypothetical protein DFJ74DRAFT_701959 [Hyaloraphidium curvatum]|nr:hypothetical protein DFJ74DRAFT_701959 [Hyaloraphidium curvatum]